MPGDTAPAEGETRYTYDAANRLTKVELYRGGGYTVLSEASYNGNGERVSLTTYALGQAETTTYVTVKGELLMTSGAEQARYHLFGNGLVGEQVDGQWHYFLHDGQASVRTIVDGTGKVVSQHTYRPFGGSLNPTGPYEGTFGFLGAQVDRLSGLNYINGRYYDPVTGRFLTPAHHAPNPYSPLSLLLVPGLGFLLWRGRRRWRAVVVVAVLSLSGLLVSCSGGTPPPTVPPPPTIPPTNTSTSTPTNTSTSTSTPTNTSTSTSTPTNTSTSTATSTSTSTPSSTPSSTSTPTPTLTPCPEPWEYLGVYRITRYTHASTAVYNKKLPDGETTDLTLPRLDGTQLEIKVKTAWMNNIALVGVAGWIDEQGVYAKCNAGGCWEVSESVARGGRGGTITPYEHVAYNTEYNKSIVLGDTVRIEGLGEKIVLDTGTGPKNPAEREKWLDYYIGIQTEADYPTVDVGNRDVWVRRN